MATTKVTTDVIADATITTAKLASTTGSGAVVLATSPTLATPTISTLTSAAATALTLQSAGTTAVTVDTSQRVGIGTASPATRKLHIYNASTGDGIRLQHAGTGASDWLISTDGNNPTDGGLIVYDLTASAYRFVIKNSSGNVGIGTANPFTQLSNTSSNIDDGATGLGGGCIGWRTNEAGFVAAFENAGTASNANGVLIKSGNTSTGPLLTVLQGANNSRFLVRADGYVGIGTASPGSTLDVRASSASQSLQSTTGTNGVSQAYINTGGTFYVGLDNSGGTSYVAGGSAYGAVINYQGNYPMQFGTNNLYRMTITGAGNVGIGTTSPNYKLEVSTDSAGKPGTGGLWTVVSDERIKANIVPADLDRCYAIVKSVPLKHFGFAPGVYTDDQIHDKHNLGWIAQDVQKVFKHAVSVKPFTLKTAIPDGTEDYEEQDFTLETVEDTKVSIEILNGKPVQISKVVKSENKILLFDTVEVMDEAGHVVMEAYEVTPAVDAVLAVEAVEAVEAVDAAEGIEAVEGVEGVEAVEAVDAVPAVMGTRPVTHQMPRMITKTRPKVRHDVIEDCLDLNSGQMIAALYGAVQALMAKVDAQAARITQLETAPS